MPLYPPYPAGTTSRAGVLQLDGTATDIQPAGTRAAGSNGLATDSGHVHPWFGAEPLAAGEAIYPRFWANGTLTLISGTLYITWWTAAKTETCNNVDTTVQGTHASGLSYAAIGIYSVNSSGDLTSLLASTGDIHSSAWPSTFAGYTAALSSGFSKVAGTLYAMAFLAVGSGPPILAVNAGPVLYSSTGPQPPVSGNLTSQSALPSSQTFAGLTNFKNAPAIEAVVRP